MDVVSESSDVALMDLLRKQGPLTVVQLAQSMGVTATAVRQRLTRLMGKQWVARTTRRAGRGRPGHVYELTETGRRQTGSNFADLAVALWQEIRSIKDPEVRRGLLQRLSRRLADAYGDQITGKTVTEKMEAVAELFGERDIPFTVEVEDELPVLKALGCPYTALAEQDPTICAMERMLFSNILGENLRLTQCRLDGEPCCTFQLN